MANLQRFYNPLIVLILRSPLHGLLSRNTMLISVTGRKSGRLFTVPVNFVRTGTALLATSLRERTWWRNLRVGAPVVVRVQGRETQAVGQAIADERDAVAEYLYRYLDAAPNLARFFQVRVDPDGHLNREDVRRAAEQRVVVRIQLSEPGESARLAPGA